MNRPCPRQGTMIEMRGIASLLKARDYYRLTVILSRRSARSGEGRSKDPLSTGDGFRKKARPQGVLQRPPPLRALRQPQDDRIPNLATILGFPNKENPWLICRRRSLESVSRIPSCWPRRRQRSPTRTS